MGRLIDADKLLQQIKFDYDLDYGETLIDPRDFADAVCNSPTVDSVPVVRRRDCIAFEEIGKHPTNNGGTPFGYCYHWQYEQGMSPRFCSYGERRKSKGRMRKPHRALRKYAPTVEKCFTTIRLSGKSIAALIASGHSATDEPPSDTGTGKIRNWRYMNNGRTVFQI